MLGKNGRILIVFEIYRWKHFVSIPMCNEHHKQCEGEGEQFPSPLKYTNGHILSVFSSE
jgi:hypothetical protein